MNIFSWLFTDNPSPVARIVVHYTYPDNDNVVTILTYNTLQEAATAIQRKFERHGYKTKSIVSYDKNGNALCNYQLSTRLENVLVKI